MMELAAIYKQRSVECERRAAEAKEESDKEAWRSRAADFRTLAVEVSMSSQAAPVDLAASAGLERSQLKSRLRDCGRMVGSRAPQNLR